MKPSASIIISSYNRLPLFRRTLFGIARRPPKCSFEVVVVDDGSTEDTLGELKKFSSQFAWKFVRFDRDAFEKKTGLKKFLNNPCVTNNIGFKVAEGDLIFQQGNEVIPWDDVYSKLVSEHPHDTPHWLVVSTTYDLQRPIIDVVDEYGSNLSEEMVRACYRWPLQSAHYRSDVTNYISLAPRELWEAIGGYDERYYGGIAAEDSDFVRRARVLPNFKMSISEGTSLHQFHSGKTCYYNPPLSVITPEKWKEGCEINRAVYDAWDGTHHNRQRWP